MQILDPAARPAPAAGTGFRPLFNGKELTGWYVESGDARQWTVEGGRSSARRPRSEVGTTCCPPRSTPTSRFAPNSWSIPEVAAGLHSRAAEGEMLLPAKNGKRIADHPLVILSDPAKYPTIPSGTTHWVKDDKTYCQPIENLHLAAGVWALAESHGAGGRLHRRHGR